MLTLCIRQGLVVSFVFTCIQITAFAQPSSTTDYFRSATSGLFSALSTWESSPNGLSSWVPSTLIPTFDANTITIRTGHVVKISSNTTIDQMVITNGAILELATGTSTSLIVNDGSGNDIIVQSGGIFKHNIGSTSTLPSFTALATLEIQGGGILDVANNNGAPSDYAVITSSISSHVLWNDNSIFNWSNTSSPLNGVTYFPTSTAIPVFRISAITSIGGSIATIINGLLEANENVSFKSTGKKTVRNGIIGLGSVAATATNGGEFIINGTTAKLGGGILTLPDAGLLISAATQLTLISNKTINKYATTTSPVNLAGTMICGDYVIDGTAKIQIDGTIKTSNAYGLIGGTNTTFATGFGVNAFGGLSIIEYNRNSDQIVTPLYYANLNITGAGIKKVGLGTDLSLIGTLDIAAPNTFTLNGTNNLVLSGATLNINANATLDNGGESQVKGGNTINIFGTFITRAVAGFSGASTSIPGATNTSPTITLNIYDGSMIEYGRLGDQLVNSRTDYKNMTFSGSGTKTLSTFNPVGTVSIKDNVIVDASNKTFGSVETNLTMTSGRFKVAGIGTKPDIDGAYNLSGGVIEFYGGTTSSKQTIRYTPTYLNIDISGLNVGNSLSNITMANGGSFTVKALGVFDNNAYRIDGTTGTQSFIMETGATFKTGVTGGLSGNATAALNNIENIIIDPKSTIIYSRLGDQVITPLPGSYPTLLLKGSGIKTVTSGTIDISSAADSVVIDPLVVLKVSSGAKINFNGTNVFVHSTVSGTGSIGEVSDGSSAMLNATKVTMERYIPAKRSFRFLSSPVTTSGSIKTAWMEGQNNPPPAYSVNNNNNPGYGTHITGSADPADGFDATATNNPSLFTFNNNTQGWEPVLNTGGILTSGAAYRLLARGSRSVDLSNNAPTPSNTTLRSTGILKTGIVVYNETSTPSIIGLMDYFSLVGNPYPSPVNWDALSKPGLSPYYYVWDPNLNTRGAYAVYGNGITNPISSQVDQNIQMGQAFFVRTSSANPSLTFLETNKTTINRSVFRSGINNVSLSIQLVSDNNIADGATIIFDNTFSTNIGDEDALKLTNLDETISITTSGKYLSIEGRPLILKGDTVQLHTTQFRQKNYFLNLTSTNLPEQVQIVIKDNYLKTESVVNSSLDNPYPFTINKDSSSYSPDRFAIIFKPVTVLAIIECEVKAFKKQSENIVEWIAPTETAIERYEVEKSVDGKQFEIIGKIQAKGNRNVTESYSYSDVNPGNGNNFYRIKIITTAHKSSYSKMVSVNNSFSDRSIRVFPNPIKESWFNLTINNFPKGNYTIAIYNSAGEKLFSKIINHQENIGTYRILTGRQISKGIFQIQISNAQEKLVERLVFK